MDARWTQTLSVKADCKRCDNMKKDTALNMLALAQMPSLKHPSSVFVVCYKYKHTCNGESTTEQVYCRIEKGRVSGNNTSNKKCQDSYEDKTVTKSRFSGPTFRSIE